MGIETDKLCYGKLHFEELVAPVCLTCNLKRGAGIPLAGSLPEDYTNREYKRLNTIANASYGEEAFR